MQPIDKCNMFIIFHLTGFKYPMHLRFQDLNFQLLLKWVGKQLCACQLCLTHITENPSLWGRGRRCCYRTNTNNYFLPVKDSKRNPQNGFGDRVGDITPYLLDFGCVKKKNQKNNCFSFHLNSTIKYQLCGMLCNLG